MQNRFLWSQVRRARFAKIFLQLPAPQDLPFPQASPDLTAPLHSAFLQSLVQMQCERDCG